VNFDFSKFHAVCGDRSVISAPDGLYVVCNKCGVVANLEAISGKIDPVDACRVGDTSRPIKGDMSPLVNKGEVKQ